MTPRLNPTADDYGEWAGQAASPRRVPPIVLALAAQAGALAVPLTLQGLLPAYATPLLQGVAAAVLGHLLRLPVWWLALNFLFAPAAFWVGRLGLHPAWFLAAFVALVLLFWTTFRSRVPLFVSSGEACEALRRLLPVNIAPRVVDLGCGLGDVIERLAPERSDASFVGFEVAPVPALVAWLRTRHHPNVRISRASFWTEHLGSYDVVYAFLSPAAMPALWRKARVEMRPGTLFVSNSFAVPGVEPQQVLPLSGRGSTALHIWRM